MGKDHVKDLVNFLRPFPAERRHTVLSLREFVWDLYPQTNELIYDNFNALAFGWSPTDRAGHLFCSVAVYRSNHNIHFGFYWGSALTDPKGILMGSGNQYRYILVPAIEKFPKSYMKRLVKEAYQNSLKKVKDPRQLKHGLTITKSVSAKKRASTKSAVKAVRKRT